ncbi:hypothetical protein ACVVIH_20580 [Chryseobacterium arthrosphaerae]|uniref:hypothetical protein n=1 Tax=Chryseobacterium arthrosphaerae TaxID=651561 RepID=UPI003D324AA1
MSHQEKQEIFDRYTAQFEEFGNFEGMIDAVLSTAIHKEELIFRIFECCDLVQEEQQKRIAERISNSEFQKGYPVDISSIINPENLIS